MNTATKLKGFKGNKSKTFMQFLQKETVGQREMFCHVVLQISVPTPPTEVKVISVKKSF